MQSKISCFNKTIFKKNLTRFWPFAVLYGLYLVFAHPLVLYVELASARLTDEANYFDRVANHFGGTTEPISVFIFSFVMTACVFGYLYQSRSANMLHTFPVTRGELFVTNYESALALMIAPQFLAALAMNFVIIGKANELIWAVWAWFGFTVGETVFFIGLSAFSAMLTGQLLPAAFFYMVWNFLYVAVVGMANVVAELFIFGLSGEMIPLHSHPLFPIAHLMRYAGFRTSVDGTLYVIGTGRLIVYALVGLLLAAAAYYAYRKRALERAGDFLSVGWMRPVFRWGLSIIGGAALSIVVTMILTDGRGTYAHAGTVFVVWFIIFAAALFFVAQMFIARSFRVFEKRVALECVSCVAVLLVGLALLQFDVFGVESYVPDVSEVAMANVSGDGSASFDSEADLERVTALHRLITERIGEHKKRERSAFVRMSEDNRNFYMGLNYTLKNGKHVSRSYWLSTDDMAYFDELWAAFSGLIYDREAAKRAFFGMNYDELDWKVASATLSYDYREPSADGTEDFDKPVYSTDVAIYGSEEEMQRLYTAALLDIEAGAFTNDGAQLLDGTAEATAETVETLEETEAESVAMNATLYLELVTEAPEEEVRLADSMWVSVSSQSVSGQSRKGGNTFISTHLYLNSGCTHLLEALVDMGVIESVDVLAL